MNEIFSGEFGSIKGIEIFNNFPNSHDIKFEDKDLDQMVSNFQKFKEKFQPNVKISHTDQQLILKELFKTENIELGEELPCLGFIKNIRREGQALFADIERIPKALMKVFGGMFKSISPEILMNFRNTGQKFIKAIVLTNNPSLRHIENVHMSEALRYGGDFKILRGDSMSAEDEKNKNVTNEELDKKLESLTETFSEKIKGFFSKKTEEKDKNKIDDNQVVSMSEFIAMKEEMAKGVILINELSNKLIDKDKSQKNFDEQLKSIRDDARSKSAESICLTAQTKGVPTAVVDYFKPILMSELTETTVKLSEVIDGKTVEAEKKLSSFIEGFFEMYPSKIKGDLSKTSLSELGDSDDEDKQFEEITKLSEEYQKTGMSEQASLEKAGRKVRGGGE